MLSNRLYLSTEKKLQTDLILYVDVIKNRFMRLEKLNAQYRNLFPYRAGDSGTDVGGSPFLRRQIVLFY
jgi:hypothetical protein